MTEPNGPLGSREPDDMTLIAILAAVLLLILTISIGRVHPFLAFVAASILAALLLGRIDIHRSPCCQSNANRSALDAPWPLGTAA